MGTELTVEEMSCEGCERIVVGAVESVAGVEGAEADHSESRVSVEGDADVDDLLEAVDMAGYEATEA